ncbi:MAG: ATP-binding protein [Candidatus Eiseniibacteriota bacterium]
MTSATSGVTASAATTPGTTSHLHLPLLASLCGTIADLLPAAALAVDPQGTIVMCNDAAAKLLALEAAELTGRTLIDALGLDGDFEATLERTLTGDGQALTIPLPTDEPTQVTLSILPCRLPGATPARRSAARAPRTTRATTQAPPADDAPSPSPATPRGALILIESQRTSSAEDDATGRLAAIGQLSAGVAHEIRNPLSGIGTNAQVLRRRFEDDDPRTRFVDFILEEVKRLDKIIEDLLLFARPSEPRMVAHDLRESIDKVLMQARGRIDEAGIDVAVEIEGEPRRAWVDPDQVAQVLLNLVLNALPAMPDGGRLTLRLREIAKFGPVVGAAGRRAGDRGSQAPKRQFLEIVVQDSGVGIAEADLPKLFEPFFTTRPSGTGLGLSTCQALIRQQGGAISVESELGRGTAVTVLIPVEKRRAPR